MISTLREYINVFSVLENKMLNTEIDVTYHRLNVNQNSRVIKQKMQVVPTIVELIKEEIKKLLNVGFFQEVQYFD